MAGAMRARPRQRPQRAVPGPNFNASGNWQDRGFESQGAARSVSNQYGLMRQPGGGWGRPTMDQFTGMMETAGYGPKFQAQSTNEAGTPVSIGGARWMMGKNGLDFTGQASDYGQGGGNAYDAAKQVPFQFGSPQGPPRPGGGGGAPPKRMGTTPNKPGGGSGLGRPLNFQGGQGGAGKPHNQIGQQGQGKGRPKPRGGGFGGSPTSGASGGVGGMPNMPPAPPNFLPMTPGFEHARGQANDALSAASGQYAEGQAMIPAQLGLQQARLQTDQGVATDQLKEQLAERGIFTPYGVGGPRAGAGNSVSPAGGGVGESLYRRQVATPYGRQAQDLGASGAAAYQDLARGYGGAQLGYNQDMFNALLGRADDAYQAMPLGASYGEYGVPNMPGPSFSFRPGGGRTRPARGRGKRQGNKGRPGGKK